MFRKLAYFLAGFLLIASVTLGFAQTTTPTGNTAAWSWTAPTTYADGTAIPSGTVITYELFTGTSAGGEAATPVWTGTTLSAMTNGYTGGTSVYGYLKACISNLCSVPSTEASKSFPLPAPDAPSNLTVK